MTLNEEYAEAIGWVADLTAKVEQLRSNPTAQLVAKVQLRFWESMLAQMDAAAVGRMAATTERRVLH